MNRIRMANWLTARLAERGRPALEELSRLSIGRVAPEIEGQEIDGHAFKLSDYQAGSSS